MYKYLIRINAQL